MRIRLTLVCLLAAALWPPMTGPAGPQSAPRASQGRPAAAEPAAVPLPNREGSLKFLVFGDFGTGEKPQYELAAQMAALCERFPAEFVITVGDQIEGYEQTDTMKLDEEWKQIKEAAEGFVEALSPGDRVSLITFDDEVYQLLDWTDNLKKARKALGKIRPGLRTALYDAMYVASKDQLQGIDGRKAIILLTDCLNNQSSIDFNDAELTIVQSQASLYVVSKTVMVREHARNERRVVMLTDIYKRLFGSDGDYIDEFFKKREAEMGSLADRTGGRCFFPTDYDQIKHVYAEVARELKSKYYLTYISNQTLAPNSYHRISVEYLEPASKIIYRKGYYYQPRMIHKAIR